MPRAAFFCVSLFVVLLLVGARTHADAPDGKTFRGKYVPLDAPVGHQLAGRAKGRPCSDGIVFEGKRFAVETRGGRLYVATRPGGAASTRVREGKPVRLALPSGPRPFLFRRHDETWRCHAAALLRFRIDGVTVAFVDLDVDGRIDDEDGMLLFGSRVALPWTRALPLATKLVRVLALHDRERTLRAALSDLPGTPLQKRALLVLNRERARHGLGLATLDPALSKGCTAHASYLERGGWDGSGDPHVQDPALPGASSEGAKSAARSVIAPQPLDQAMQRFLTTYYHRIGPCHPDLERVGMNADAESVAVIDVSQAYERRRSDGDRWPHEVTVPADGSIGARTYATSEKPTEPVPDLASRGPPLVVYLRERAPVVTDVACVLTLADGAGTPEIVPTLVADPGVFPFVVGAVPASRLRDRTAYVAVLSWKRGGRSGRAEIRFRTGVTPRRRRARAPRR